MRSFHILALAATAIFLTACGNGGTLNLEAVHKVTSKATPTVQINQGGKALIVESGQTAATGVHGYVSIKAVSGGSLSSGVGQPIVVLRSQSRGPASIH